MRRTILSLLVLAVAATVPHHAIAKSKPKGLGVFGTINGKSFKATNKQGVDDPCLFGTYSPTTNVLAFSALECKGKRRRQGVAVKKNYKGLLIACQDSDSDPNSPPLTPPFDLTCPFSAYTEFKTGRFGIPVGMDEWGADLTIDPITFQTSSQVNMHVESFDGTIISGTITGVFTQPLAGNATPPAQIEGEVRFAVPIKVQ
jgi:hypothetical protein